MPQICTQCGSAAADEASTCENCGGALTHASPTSASEPTTPHPVPEPTTHSAAAVPAYKFDASRWSLADRIAGVATFVLFITLFLAWFSYNTSIGIVTWTGLGAHWYLYLVMLVCIVTVAYLVLRAGWDELPLPETIPHLVVMMVATIFNLVLVFLAFIFKPGGYNVSGVGWEFGAFLALIAAIVAAAPYAIPQLRAKTMG